MIVLYLMASAEQCSRFLLRKQSAVFSRRMCNGLTLYESLVKSHCVTGTANAKPVARLSQSPVVANSSSVSDDGDNVQHFFRVGNGRESV